MRADRIATFPYDPFRHSRAAAEFRPEEFDCGDLELECSHRKMQGDMRSPHLPLVGIKLLHTIVWAFFAGCILILPVAAWRSDFALAAVLIGLVLVEVGVLVANGMRCPLTDVAARYTDDRHDNFDIYLPVWLARYTKVIFGWLFVAGLLFTLWQWGVGT